MTPKNEPQKPNDYFTHLGCRVQVQRIPMAQGGMREDIVLSTCNPQKR